jgi:hypothetical protein
MADAIAGSNGTAPAAGDTVYCKGTDTLAGTPTNAISGSEASGLVRWIGVNADGNNDGTRTVMDCNGGNFNALTLNAPFNLYENFRFTGSGNASGVAGTGDDCVLINCSLDTNGLYGWNGSGMSRFTLIRCVAHSNTNDGFYPDAAPRFFFCCSRDNSQSGFDVQFGSYAVLIGCLAYDNANDGIESLFYTTVAFNCVIDSNVDDGITAKSGTNYICSVIGCRITNQSGAGDIGLFCNSEIALYGWNFFDNNADHLNTEGVSYAVTHNGAATNIQVNEAGAGGGNTNQGYTSTTEGSEDYNLRSDATLRRTAITIPLT